MTTWSLSQLLAGLHERIEQDLARARASFGHPGTKGDASQDVWLELLNHYLPERYRAASAHIVDSKGAFSDQLDVVVYDRQYSPVIFKMGEQIILPAESVYAVFEAKQAINLEQVRYATDKVASVRKLYRTSLPIPSAGGMLPAREPSRIAGGLLCFESDWSPPLGVALLKALQEKHEGGLDLGCVAAHGIFGCDEQRSYSIAHQGKPATAFLFELIARLQAIATVGMINVRAYAAWLK
jgi:hypothetical protein